VNKIKDRLKDKHSQ